jgi:hypothetical protein
MNSDQRITLTKALSAHVGAIAADLRAQMLVEGVVRDRAKRLHRDEQVGEDFDVWTDVLSRRAAVLWVLKTVYVRVLEDRGLVAPGRLLDPETQQLFEKLVPNLGETAFLSWVFRDLASPRGGLPELFAPQPAEVGVPADALSRSLIGFWRAKDADTGFQWSFADETFAGELMGDLYQDLDPVVKDRYALCQTPAFVRDFMLGQTLTPAIAELGADAVRVLDPACGSGHFLLDALRRLAKTTAAQHQDWAKRQVVDHALERVVGIDLNDYACALARARMVMTAAELAGVTSLGEAASFHPNVYWADGLEQVERDDDREAVQLDLLSPGNAPPPRAVLTRPHVRAVLRPLLKRKFQVVIGNPPYITERDPARKDYHREVVGQGKKKQRRYVTAYREYSLAAPFIERALQLAESGGRIGLIVGNNFMKREFGKPLIEDVLAKIDLELVVDSSQAFIPHHGTPTVILFAKNQKRSGNGGIRTVMGKRGDPGIPTDPSKGLAWTSLVGAVANIDFDNEFAVGAQVLFETMATYPWSLGPGGVVRHRLEAERRARLSELVQLPIGRAARIALEAVFLVDSPIHVSRSGMAPAHFTSHYRGAGIRDWYALSYELVWFPYSIPDGLRRVVPGSKEWAQDLNVLWRYRTPMAQRATFQGVMKDAELEWYEYMQFTRSLVATDQQISFANVATHNHFAFVQGRFVFNSKAPVVKLPPGSSKDEHLAVLGLLNSSVACFWMKQVFHCKGIRGEGGGTTAELWEQFFEFDATKLKLFPIPNGYTSVVPWARELDQIANRRHGRSVAWVLSGDDWRQAADLRAQLQARREADLVDLGLMVALQEELDWECYRLFAIDRQAKGQPPEHLDGIAPTWRPSEILLATRDRETRAAIERGEESTEIPTVWFERHRWEPILEVPAAASAHVRDRIAARRRRIDEVPELALIEQPTYKRRWYRPDHAAQEQAALGEWLGDRIEAEISQRGAKATSIAQLTATLEEDPRVHAVVELLTERKDYRLADVIAETVAADAVPQHPFHVYKPTGLSKRAAWERTWDEQRKEDAGLPAKPEVPPKYTGGDFLKPEYFRLRGKLDVPKERFIALTELPGRGAGETLYGWAGWTAAERIRAILSLDETCEDQGIPLDDRIALLDSAWRLVPDVVRGDAALGARLRAELAALVGPDGPSKPLLDAWKAKFPPPKTRGGGPRRAAKTTTDVEDEEE